MTAHANTKSGAYLSLQIRFVDRIASANVFKASDCILMNTHDSATIRVLQCIFHSLTHLHIDLSKSFFIRKSRILGLIKLQFFFRQS